MPACLLLPTYIGVGLRCLCCGKFKPIDMYYVNFGISDIPVSACRRGPFITVAARFHNLIPFFITCRMKSVVEDARRWIAAEVRRVDLLRCSEETLNMAVQSEDTVTPWKKHCLYIKLLFWTETECSLRFILSEWSGWSAVTRLALSPWVGLFGSWLINSTNTSRMATRN